LLSILDGMFRKSSGVPFKALPHGNPSPWLVGFKRAQFLVAPLLVLTVALPEMHANSSGDGNPAERLDYVILGPAELDEYGLIPNLTAVTGARLDCRIPELTLLSKLTERELSACAIPLPEADTLAGRNFVEGHFGRIQTKGQARLINPGIILVKFRKARHVAALRVEPLRELDALWSVRQRSDVEFAELDSFERRQFIPNDALLTNQWHHAVIGSFQAWDHSLGQPFVRVALVDTPFQMDHPDLASQTDPGWDVVNGVPVTSSSGIDHSTLGAGLAAAAIGNQLGVAGACNCRILPININGAISEMYAAVIWAADHGVRVVNISWTGANSDTLNVAGNYLQVTARGILAMAGVNGTGFLDYTNQPYIYCIAMTDAADQPRSRFGNHIDFAAPGWAIFSTVAGGGYGSDSGTSYSTPLFSGVVAALFSINPTLGPEEVIELLKQSATDLGPPGWDQYYGWGRINFAAAAVAADASRPLILSLRLNHGSAVLTVTNQPASALTLWRTPDLKVAPWETVTNAALSTNAGLRTLTDPTPGPVGNFYRVEARMP